MPTPLAPSLPGRASARRTYRRTCAPLPVAVRTRAALAATRATWLDALDLDATPATPGPAAPNAAERWSADLDALVMRTPGHQDARQAWRASAARAYAEPAMPEPAETETETETEKRQWEPGALASLVMIALAVASCAWVAL